MKLPLRVRVDNARERLADLAHRPVCWLLGHQPLYKMDLHGSAICRRCAKFIRGPR